MRFLLLPIFLLLPLAAQDVESGKRVWKTSLISMAAAEVLDAHSSWGKCEANGFLAGASGRFDGKALAIKSGAIAGLILGETAFTAKHPKLYKLFTSVNFTVGTGIGAMAIRNYTISAPGATCR